MNACKLLQDRKDGNSMIGRIHSLETFGTLDGPGIRFVLFMQGCALQCAYCHNPDTWDIKAGREMKVEEVLSEIEPFVKYYELSGGGITVSGGEPTLQAPFIAELFKACKERWNLHTAIDSSGYCEPTVHVTEMLEYTDLILLDLKEMDEERHIALTSQSNARIMRFARHLSELNKRIWVRFVLVPELTDRAEQLIALGQFIEQLRSVEKVEVLPYHRMGVYKWQQIGRPYELDAYREPTAQEVKRAYEWIERGRSSGGAEA